MREKINKGILIIKEKWLIKTIFCLNKFTKNKKKYITSLELTNFCIEFNFRRFERIVSWKLNCKKKYTAFVWRITWLCVTKRIEDVRKRFVIV